MAVGALIQHPYLVFVDENGAPLANGYVEIYAAGTLNPLPIYSDIALTIPQGTSVDLTSTGVLDGYVDPSLAYKFKVFKEDGSFVRERDFMRFAAPSSSADRTRFDILNRR